MADKTSTLVLAVNLSCCRCHVKIRKTLSKFEEIQCLLFDEKQNMVTISGRFDPEKLEMKLRCKARNCITGCEIKIEKRNGEPSTNPTVDDPPCEETPPANPPPSVDITVNVIGIPFLPYVPNVCQCQRPCREVICDGKCRPPSVPMVCPKRCHGACEEDGICSCSGYGSGSICSSPSFW
ncbi:hypothetical protein AAC387_Pa05g1583 [Persea americana]